MTQLPTFAQLAQARLDYAGKRDKNIDVKVTIGTARMMIEAETELFTAATRLLEKIDVITTEDFSKGGEREEREALRAILARFQKDEEAVNA